MTRIKYKLANRRAEQEIGILPEKPSTNIRKTNRSIERRNGLKVLEKKIESKYISSAGPEIKKISIRFS